MKIINKREFLKLPAGVLYCQAILSDPSEEIGSFDKMYIKGGTCSALIRNNEEPNDWVEIDVTQYANDGDCNFFDRSAEMYEMGKSYPLELSSCRNGLYEDYAKFLVYEKADIELLIAELQKCRGIDEK